MKIILLLCPIPRQDKKQISLFAVTQNLDSIERQWRALLQHGAESTLDCAQ